MCGKKSILVYEAYDETHVPDLFLGTVGCKANTGTMTNAFHVNGEIGTRKKPLLVNYRRTIKLLPRIDRNIKPFFVTLYIFIYTLC